MLQKTAGWTGQEEENITTSIMQACHAMSLDKINMLERLFPELASDRPRNQDVKGEGERKIMLAQSLKMTGLTDAECTLWDFTLTAKNVRAIQDVNKDQKACIMAGATRIAASCSCFQPLQLSNAELEMLPNDVALAILSRESPGKSLCYPGRFFADTATLTNEHYRQAGRTFS